MFNFLRKKKEYKYKYGDVVKAIVFYHRGCDYRQVETLVILRPQPYAKGLQYYAHKENDNEVLTIWEDNVLELLPIDTNTIATKTFTTKIDNSQLDKSLDHIDKEKSLQQLAHELNVDNATEMRKIKGGYNGGKP